MHFDARQNWYYFGGAMFAAMWMPGARALENASDANTVVVCPPSAPPPAPPPDLGSWAGHVPAWFWLTFVTMLLTSVGGCGAMGYVLYTVRRFQRRQADDEGGRLGRGTASSLARLEARVQSMCDGM